LEKLLKPTERRILSLWKDNPHWTPSYTEIRKTLGATQAQGPTVKSLLQALVDEGRLVRERQRYRLADSGSRETGHGHPVEDGYDGTIVTHPDGYGFVSVTELRQDVFIPPRYVDGALDGDRVRVTVRKQHDGRLSGRVKEVLERKRDRVRGHWVQDNNEAWVEPLSERLPLVAITDGVEKRRRNRPHPGDLVDIALTRYPETTREAPEGSLVRVVEDPEAPQEIIDYICAEAGIRTAYSPDTEEEMQRLSHARKPQRRADREDLRDLPFVTIDGEDAKDFDDAVCLEPLDNGNHRLYVSIADVAAYVTLGTAVDAEAYRRGTSVYFPGTVIPMLPEVLSNDLCSLRPREDRLTLTCEMELDGGGAVLHYDIYESVIHSRHRLTYTQVRDLLDDGETGGIDDPDVREMLLQMGRVADVLRDKRHRRGAINFAFPEFRFELDEAGHPVNIRKVYANTATRLIEQFMLEANETVAQHCIDNRLPVLYRVHEPPPADERQALLETLWNYGVPIEEGDPADHGWINHVLALVEEHPERDLLEMAVLRSMSQAQYRATNDGHFGLAAENYCHFTSPIRRYPDLIVHRALKAHLHGKKPPQLPPEAGPHLTERDRSADEASWQVIKLFKVIYMEPHLGEAFAGTVSGLTGRGLFVNLEDPMVDGFLPLDTLPGHYRVDQQRGVLRGSKRKDVVKVGTPLTVQLVRADRLSQQLELTFAHWGWPEGWSPADSAAEG